MSREERKPGAPPGQMSQEEIRQAARSAVGNGAASHDDDRIERIRDLLVGGHLQEITRQLTRLESRLEQETADLKEAFLRRCDALEHDMKTAVEALNQRLSMEQNTRAGDIEELVRDVNELGGILEKKTEQLAIQTAERQHELRELLLEQSKVLAEDIRDRYAGISVLLEQQLEDLRQAKTDRGTLASLFGEMAMRLNHEGLSPESDGEESQ